VRSDPAGGREAIDEWLKDVLVPHVAERLEIRPQVVPQTKALLAYSEAFSKKLERKVTPKELREFHRK
jgi:uncharacterized protein YqcC (DUF446 family)